ncbi:MAG: LacI family DNA-binding transcriptional regulator [Casimicrobiaceae bacterium]
MPTRQKPSATVRIKDVALRARVSSGTVSHVLTGHTRVSETLRARVQKAIDALGYVPNFHAQGLRHSRSRVVGICLPHASTAYLNTLSQTLEETASAAGYGVMHVFSRHDSAIELDRIRDLVRYGVDGLVLLPSLSPANALEMAARKNVPLVIVDRPIADRRFDQVTLDNRAAMREVTERLIALGHRRLLFVCHSQGRLATRHRLQALATVCANSPHASFRTIEHHDDSEFLRDELARVLLQRPRATAWVVSNSHQASIVLGYLAERGVRCPEDVSVLAFDDPEWSTLVRPRLSVVRQPARAMAHAAWDLLLQRINGSDQAPQTVALGATVELRASVAAPHAKPGVVALLRGAGPLGPSRG